MRFAQIFPFFNKYISAQRIDDCASYGGVLRSHVDLSAPTRSRQLVIWSRHLRGIIRSEQAVIFHVPSLVRFNLDIFHVASLIWFNVYVYQVSIAIRVNLDYFHVSRSICVNLDILQVSGAIRSIYVFHFYNAKVVRERLLIIGWVSRPPISPVMHRISPETENFLRVFFADVDEDCNKHANNNPEHDDRRPAEAQRFGNAVSEDFKLVILCERAIPSD